MSNSSNAKMIKQITNPPTRKKKMTLSSIFEKSKKRIKKMTKKMKKGAKRRKKKTQGY
tara:strand:- start:16 stop:189 length:174 start_codon:yes stop_codon:yes gene_type:complete